MAKLNNRVVFSDVDNNGEIDVTIPTTEVMETHTYYPFGMKIEGMESIEACPVYQPYGYNGKEKLLPDVYDYGVRMYMASIGRWTSVDPLAHKMPDWSSYNYAFNNPIRFIDPDGSAPHTINGPGDPPVPTVAGILYEAYLNADAAVFNFIAKGAEALGYGSPGINVRKEIQYDNYGGVSGNKIVEKPEGSWGEAVLETLGDALAFTPIGVGAKRMLGPVLAAKNPGLKNGAVKWLKEGELAKRLNTTVDDYHSNIKPLMKSDHSKEMKQLGSTNPDFTPNEAGKLVLKNPKSGKTLTTDTDFKIYIKDKKMIKNIYCSASINGDYDVSSIIIPSQLKSVLSSNKGEIVNMGRYLGQISLESRLIINGDLDDVLDFTIDNFLDLIYLSKVNINLTINIKWKIQCNFELNHEQLKKITRLNIPCGISCYMDEN